MLSFSDNLSSAPSPNLKEEYFWRVPEPRSLEGSLHVSKDNRFARFFLVWRISLQSLHLSINFYLQTVIAELQHISKINGDSVYSVGHLAHTLPRNTCVLGLDQCCKKFLYAAGPWRSVNTGLIFSTLSSASSTWTSKNQMGANQHTNHTEFRPSLHMTSTWMIQRTLCIRVH